MTATDTSNFNRFVIILEQVPKTERHRERLSYVTLNISDL